MKKISFAIAFSVAALFATAQESNNICVYNSLQTYDGGKGDPQDLVRAMKCSDEAVANEATSGKSKTWYYRAQLYTLIFQDTTLRKTNPNAANEAFNSVKKISELNDPKFKDWDDLIKYYMNPLQVMVFNAAIDRFRTKEYEKAYAYFSSMKDVITIIEGRGKKGPIEKVTLLKNISASAENAGKNGDAFTAMEELYKLQPDTLSTIQAFANLAKKLGNTAKYNELVDEGLKKYPGNAQFLAEKINSYLAKGDYKGGLAYVYGLLDANPLNDKVWVVKGEAYNQMYRANVEKMDSLGAIPAKAKEYAELKSSTAILGDSVVQAYTQATVVNAKNFDAWFKLGAHYFDQGVSLNNRAAKLGTSAEDIKKSDAMSKERNEMFLKSKPYFEKAKELDPSDAEVKRALTKIDLYTAK